MVTNYISHRQFFFRVDFPSFDLLERRLQAKYNRLPPNDIPLKWKKSAFAACVKNWWHRAEVLSIGVGSRARVMLVDNGRCIEVPLKNLRLLDREDVEVPVKTVCCALRGVMLGDGYDLNVPMEDVLGVVVEARFVSNIGENKYSTILTQGMSIGNQLK
jgi:hypothetical protein